MGSIIAPLCVGAALVQGFLLVLGLIRVVWFAGSWVKHKADRARTEARALAAQLPTVAC